MTMRATLHLYRCACGACFDPPLDPAKCADTGWRVTTDGPKNVLVWWCPACWAKRIEVSTKGFNDAGSPTEPE